MPSVRHQMAARLVSAQPRPEALSVEVARVLMRDFSRLFPLPDDIRIEGHRIGALETEWLIPHEPPLGTMLYLHGGGYCLGSIESHRALSARIAIACGCRVLLIGYRLAPEQPFPAALEDALASYRWLLEEGIEATRLLIAGDSSGGGLALAVLLALKARDTPLPAGAICLSPWADLTLTDAATAAETRNDPMVNVRDARRLAAYYAEDADLRNPLISPLYGDPTGLPPLLLQVGTREILLDDARRLSKVARRAGVDVTLQEWSGLMHVWQIFAPMVPEAVEAIDALGRWARRVLGGAQPVAGRSI